MSSRSRASPFFTPQGHGNAQIGEVGKKEKRVQIIAAVELRSRLFFMARNVFIFGNTESATRSRFPAFDLLNSGSVPLRYMASPSMQERRV